MRHLLLLALFLTTSSASGQAVSINADSPQTKDQPSSDFRRPAASAPQPAQRPPRPSLPPSVGAPAAPSPLQTPGNTGTAPPAAIHRGRYLPNLAPNATIGQQRVVEGYPIQQYRFGAPDPRFTPANALALEETRKLRNSVLTAPDDAARDKAAKALREHLQKRFDEQLAQREADLKKLEARVNELRKSVEYRRKNRERVVTNYVEAALLQAEGLTLPGTSGNRAQQFFGIPGRPQLPPAQAPTTY